ncbi:AzlC family ABC transporter permease [Permianibacter aggregans]|uniref:4-azaleucine resistance transporter AzlC n=1 Tax=Permianibacter aggregans TaxID=1510150 RepID=A0A4R6ULJ0_9GAMM|nr:AzlC family ABC transporter permease [Permianibacter aggregans]QGX39950.1 hypothetical protein E2H98_09870 [Permianibacter aggregans]TDQ46243.1 4-azaleucine resistance transporter AzlC [Permianibacter aggregans]
MMAFATRRARLRVLLGVKRFIPLALPLLAFGASFGLYATQIGFAGEAAIAMSLLTFAGAAQFAALGVVATGGSLLALALAVLLINARYLSMGLTVSSTLPKRRIARLFCAQLMVDESWLLSRNRRGRHSSELFIGVGIAEFLLWALGTVVGVWFAAWLPSAQTLGIDIGITAFFLALLAGQLDNQEKRLAAISSGVLTLILILVNLSQLALLLAPLPILIYLSIRQVRLTRKPSTEN